MTGLREEREREMILEAMVGKIAETLSFSHFLPHISQFPKCILKALELVIRFHVASTNHERLPQGTNPARKTAQASVTVFSQLYISVSGPLHPHLKSQYYSPICDVPGTLSGQTLSEY